VKQPRPHARRSLPRADHPIERPELRGRSAPLPGSAPQPGGAPQPLLLPPPRPARVEKPAASQGSRRGLDWFAFFLANMQTGFGPFVAVYFTTQRWTQADIGLVLTIGGLVSLFGQVPGGALVDAVRAKRLVAGLSVAIIAASAAMIAIWPVFPVVLLAMILHSVGSCTLTPAIASMSLGLVGHERVGERLGRNASFSAVGSAIAAAAMGACGYYVSNEAVFFVTAALVVPSLMALSAIRPAEIDPRVAAGGTETASSAPGGWLALLRSRTLAALVACITLFYLANAAMLPLAGGWVTVRASDLAPILIAACIVVPQVVTAGVSPWIGRAAQRFGRRPLLLIGFAALPARGVLFGIIGDPHLLPLLQVFDGISAAVLGVLVPLVVADATRSTGRFSVALGAVGTAMGLGAAASTYVAGLMADRLGTQTAFLGLAGVGAVAFVLAAIVMPETRRRERSRA
jgi:MFS family permease